MVSDLYLNLKDELAIKKPFLMEIIRHIQKIDTSLMESPASQAISVWQILCYLCSCLFSVPTGLL